MKHSFLGLAGALVFLPCALGTASCGTDGDVAASSQSPNPSGSGGGGGGGGNWCNEGVQSPGIVPSQRSSAVDVDHANNVVVTGSFVGVLHLGDASPVRAYDAGPDIFVAKLDAESKPLWTRQLHARNGDGLGVAFDPNGNVVVTGYVFGGILCDDLPPGTPSDPVNQDILVAKLDPDGNVLWTRVFSAPSDQMGFDVATNSDGDIFVTVNMTTGSPQGSDLTFDEIDTTLHVEGSASALLMKLSPNGSVVWAKSFGNSLSTALSVDGADHIVLAGRLQGTTDFGGPPLTSESDFDAFLAKFDGSGKHLWSRSFGGPGWGDASDVAVDSGNNIILSSVFSAYVDTGDGPILGDGNSDAVLSKYEPSGNHLWSRGFLGVPENTFVTGASVDVDSADNVIVAGTYGGSVDLGGGPLVNAKADDIFLAKFDPSGGWLANQRFGTDSGDQAIAVRVDQTGRTVLTGDNAAIDFGEAPKVHNDILPLGFNHFFVTWLAP